MFEIVYFSIMGIAALALLVCFYILWRNERVFAFRQGLLTDMDTALGDRDNDPVVAQQLADYDAVSYHEMVYKFWKPLTVKSWYPGTSLDRSA